MEKLRVVTQKTKSLINEVNWERNSINGISKENTVKILDALVDLVDLCEENMQPDTGSQLKNFFTHDLYGEANS